MNKFVERLQRDLTKLHETLEKEGDELIQRIRKKAAQYDGVGTKTEEFSALIESKLRRFEPAMERFYKELKVNARKYGIDLTGIEEKVMATTAEARQKFKPASKKTTKRKATKKATTKAKTKRATKSATKTKKKTATKRKAVKKTTRRAKATT